MKDKLCTYIQKVVADTECCPDVNVSGYFKPFNENTIPTNLSIDNCQLDKLSKCFDSRFVNYDIEPQLLNKDGLTKFSPDTSKITILNENNLGINIDCKNAFNLK